jgi:type II secretory pathway pseudopilin PulG
VGSQRRRRQRGFSLLVVFMLIIVMVGAAAAVMLSTQQDLSVSGQDREQLQAFYAAEYAIAMAKDYLAANSATVFASKGWGDLLGSTNPYVCPFDTPTQPTAPTRALPSDDTNPWNDFPGTFYVTGAAAGAAKAQYRFCFANDPDDINFADANDGTIARNGNTTDDANRLLTIQGYGQVVAVNGSTTPQVMATSKVWVIIGKPTGQTAVLSTHYGTQGAGGDNSGNGGAMEAGTTVNLGSVRGL